MYVYINVLAHVLPGVAVHDEVVDAAIEAASARVLLSLLPLLLAVFVLVVLILL